MNGWYHRVDAPKSFSEPASSGRRSGALRRLAGPGAAAAARFRRCAARPLGPHDTGRRRLLSVVARGAPAHGDRAHGPVRRPSRQRALRQRHRLRGGPRHVARARAVRERHRRAALRGHGERRAHRRHYARGRRRGRAVHGDARAGAPAGVTVEVARRDAALERPRSYGLGAAQCGARGLLARARRSAGRDTAVRRSRDRCDVPRFSIARRAQVPAGQQ